MKIKEKIVDNIAVLSLSGELIGEPGTVNLKDKIQSLITDDIKNVVIDLADVTYINSSGLGTLISVLNLLKNAGGDLKLSRIGDKLQNLFMITQLIKVFDTYETQDRALANFKK